jgi:phage-related tail fiber protein
VRSVDSNTSAKVTPGLSVMVEEGTANGDSLWHLVTNGPISLGTTALSFEMLAGRTGIQAGTYKSLTVDKYGRAIAGDNPTTAAGYGLTDVYTKAQVEAFALGVAGDRVGEVTHFAMVTPPAGFLKRNGAAVSRTTYAALFARIGTYYGVGDGATTFNLPDSRAHFDRGFDDGRNVDPGRVFGSVQASQNAAHVHTASAAVAGAHTHGIWINLDRGPGTEGNAVWGDEPWYGSAGTTTSSNGDHTHAITIASSGGTEARPLNTAYLACIKY